MNRTDQKIGRAVGVLGIVFLSYIVSLLAPVLSLHFPQLRFYGKYVFIASLGFVFLSLLFNGFRLRAVPGAILFLLFTAYFLLHNVIFEHSIEMFGQSIILLYSLYLCFCLVVRNRGDYLIALISIWSFMALGLVYYLRALYQFRGGLLFSSQRIDSVEVGQTLNSNVLCFLAVIFSILSLRLYEIWRLSQHKRTGPVEWWRLIFLFSILLLCLLFVLLHASMMSSFLMATVIIFSFFLLPVSFKTKMGLVFLISLIGIYGISKLDDEGLLDQMSLIEERINDAGSSSERIDKIQYVYSKFEKNPIFGSSAENAVYDGTGSTNHTFYLNVLAIYGLFGFILFGLLVISLLLPGLKAASPAQLLARFFLLMVWITAPTNYLQIVALVIIIPYRRFEDRSN